jgi:hypothetical protein
MIEIAIAAVFIGKMMATDSADAITAVAVVDECTAVRYAAFA